MSIKVLKFGGSSLANAEQFKKVAKIISENHGRVYIVVSAPGKRYCSDTKVTDLLYKFHGESREELRKKYYYEISERYREIIDGLGLTINLTAELEGLYAHRGERDYVASRGEHINAKILAHMLGFDFIDSSELILFNDDGKLELDKSNSIISDKLSRYNKAVIPGFYGASASGRIITFSRGGSDISGSIIAAGVNADVYENWTDVGGVLRADPKIVEEPSVITELTYTQLRALAYNGATVLHEYAVYPLINLNIPINIKNTDKPTEKGTFIVKEVNDQSTNSIVGIGAKEGCTMLCVRSDMREGQRTKILAELIKTIDSHGILCERTQIFHDRFRFYLRGADSDIAIPHLAEQIYADFQPDGIEIKSNITLITVVGRFASDNHTAQLNVFSALQARKIPVFFTDYSSDGDCISVAVEDIYTKAAVNALYKRFFAV